MNIKTRIKLFFDVSDSTIVHLVGTASGTYSSVLVKPNKVNYVVAGNKVVPIYLLQNNVHFVNKEDADTISYEMVDWSTQLSGVKE